MLNQGQQPIDPAIGGDVAMGGSPGTSGADDNGDSSGKKNSKKPLSDSKRAQQNRQAQVC